MLLGDDSRIFYKAFFLTKRRAAVYEGCLTFSLGVDQRARLRISHEIETLREERSSVPEFMLVESRIHTVYIGSMTRSEC